MSLVGAAFILIGFVFELLVVWQFRLASASRAWRRVPGVIIHSDIEADSSGDSTTYQPVIYYTYSYGGHEFTGDLIGYTAWFSNFRSRAKSYFMRYPLGKVVTVYVDPTKPSRAVLEPGMNPVMAFFAVAFGLPFIAIGFGLS